MEVDGLPGLLDVDRTRDRVYSVDRTDLRSHVSHLIHILISPHRHFLLIVPVPVNRYPLAPFQRESGLVRQAHECLAIPEQVIDIQVKQAEELPVGAFFLPPVDSPASRPGD